MARRKRIARLIASMLVLGLAACGGDGGSQGTSTNPTGENPTPTPSPATSTALPAGSDTAFVDRTDSWSISHGFGFSTGLNPMVAQFAGGAASGDIDGDGDIDVFVARGDTGPNLLYINQGGSFAEGAEAAGIAYTMGPNTNGRHSGPTFGDLDGDGDLDLLMGGLEGGPTKLFRNDGSGKFTDATPGSGFDGASADQTISIAFGDYDSDGDLDVAMAHWGTPRDPTAPGETETLWRNDGGLRFTPVSVTTGINALLAFDLPQGVLGRNYDYTFAPSFADIDGDRDLDLLMVSDFRGSRVLVNNGNSTFSLGSFTPDDENGMGTAVGDYDNDGDLDWFISSINGNRMFQSNGTGGFRRAPETGVEPGGWGWGSCFADFNLDGWLDIYQTNGWEAGKDPSASIYVDDTSRLWMNRGDGSFADRAEASGMLDTDQGRGVVCDDFDNDGDVDVLLLTAEPSRSAILWINQSSGANFLKIRLRGKTPNTFAIGARIDLTISDTTQTRTVAINSNFTSHNSADQLFGLGSHTSAGLRITWPDGAESILASVAANQTLLIDHPSR